MRLLYTLLVCYLLLAAPVRAQRSDSTRRPLLHTVLPLVGAATATYAVTADAYAPSFGLFHAVQGRWGSAAASAGLEGALLALSERARTQLAQQPLVPVPPTTLARYTNPDYPTQSNYQLHTAREQSRQALIHLSLIDLYGAYAEARRRRPEGLRVPVSQARVGALMIAPFRGRYLRRPAVFVPALLAGLIGVLSGEDGRRYGDVASVQQLGQTYSPGAAWALNAAVDAGQYVLTAAGEEMLFRGMVQGELTERWSPAGALVTSSALFALYHVPNGGWGNAALALPAGFYFGYRYRRSGYDLGEVIATHFWVDFLPSLIGFVRDPAGGRLVYSVSWRL